VIADSAVHPRVLLVLFLPLPPGLCRKSKKSSGGKDLRRGSGKIHEKIRQQGMFF